MCGDVCGNAPAMALHVEIRGQFSYVSSFLLPYGYQGLNAGYQPRQQVPLPAEPFPLLGRGNTGPRKTR